LFVGCQQSPTTSPTSDRFSPASPIQELRITSPMRNPEGEYFADDLKVECLGEVPDRKTADASFRKNSRRGNVKCCDRPEGRRAEIGIMI
jgi:hypothetical protein